MKTNTVLSMFLSGAAAMHEIELKLIDADSHAHSLRSERNALMSLPQPPSYMELLEAMGNVVERLDDASCVVDPGENEEFAYQNALRAARINMSLASGDVEAFLVLRPLPHTPEQAEETYDSKTIERENTREDSDYLVYGHDTYGPESVNEGMSRRTYLNSYDTVQEAQEAHPDAESIEGSTKCEYHPPHCPPAGFDPGYAGEVW